MKYRINRRTGDRISEIGLGSAYLCDADMDEAVRALRGAGVDVRSALGLRKRLLWNLFMATGREAFVRL